METAESVTQEFFSATLRSKKLLRFEWTVSPPEPPTSIFIVPFGPRLVLITSCSPLAALMFINRAADLPMTSAFGLSVLRDDMLT